MGALRDPCHLSENQKFIQKKCLLKKFFGALMNISGYAPALHHSILPINIK